MRKRLNSKILAITFCVFSFFGSADGSIIKFPPPSKGDEVTYKDLPCSDQDRSYIFEIITTMAENGKISLLLKQNHLKQMGAQINHVHPLKFLSTIFTNDRLKECMVPIFDDYFKRNGFMDGLGPSLTVESEKGKLESFLPEFANEVQIPADALRPYFQSRDWEGLVRQLMQM